MKKTKKTGQAMVEYALMLPIFMLIFLGIVDFAITLHCWSTLNLQCAQAARAGTKRVTQLVARTIVTANTHADATAVSKAFWYNRSPLMASASYSNVTFAGPDSNALEVIVSADYQVSMWTPMLNSLVGKANGTGKLVLHASARERKE